MMWLETRKHQKEQRELAGSFSGGIHMQMGMRQLGGGEGETGWKTIGRAMITTIGASTRLHSINESNRDHD